MAWFPCELSLLALSASAFVAKLLMSSVKLESRQARLLPDCHPQWPKLGQDQLERDIPVLSRDVFCV